MLGKTPTGRDANAVELAQLRSLQVTVWRGRPPKAFRSARLAGNVLREGLALKTHASAARQEAVIARTQGRERKRQRFSHSVG
jgi:hypothetical protein